jgi:hypothetical protein
MKITTDYMKLLIISFILVACGRAGDLSENEVGRIFDEFSSWQRTQTGYPLELPKQYRELLEEFSSEEIVKGLLDYYKVLDMESKMTNHRYSSVTVLKFNDYLIKDTLPLHEMLAKHVQPREFWHLSGLALALTKARGDDFIPSFFNTLFRDGRVAREQGEYTSNHAHDVSVLAHKMILITLKKFESDYLSTMPEYFSSHEEEVDHLARWLIANWPGCEDFTLSDQNVPAILSSSSTKRISRIPKGKNDDEPKAAGKDFELSWPMITAIILLAGSLSYWAKKRFSH